MLELRPNALGKGKTLAKINKSSEQYKKVVKRAQIAENKKSKEGRDIGDIPPVKNSKRKARALKDFKYYCEQYHAETFYLPWCEDHLKVIAKIQRAVLKGELFAIAMPRGAGKSALVEAALIWAALTGRHQYIIVIGATDKKATKTIANIKIQLETNEKLLEDFPESIFPFVCLENQARRCDGQLHHGKQTHIEWKTDSIVFAGIPGNKASYCCIEAMSMTANIRGALHGRPDNTKVRPSLVIPDDPQTDASAKNPAQCKKRIDLLNGAILGLAGPGKKIAGLMPCTVIKENDMADQILDHEKHPEWQGERTKMVYEFPINEKLWDEYEAIRADSYRQGKGLELATNFYKENREAMDEGSVIAWPERFDKDELSALQNAMNLKFRDEKIFFAEYQNEPVDETEDDPEKLVPDDIMLRLNGLKRGQVPEGTKVLTAFIDVGADELHYTVLALSESFSGAVIDYGIFPGGQATLRDDGSSIQGAIIKGLNYLDQTVMQREYYGEAGTYRIELCLIDGGYEADAIAKFIEGKSAIYKISFGIGVSPDQVPIPERKKKPEETLGFHWAQRRKDRKLRIMIDTSRWKTFSHRRFLIAVGEPGSMTIWGDKEHRHFEWAVQVASSERKEMVTGKSGRTIAQWKQNPVVPNHFFDTFVGALVAGSVCGIVDVMQTSGKRKERKRVKYSERQRKAGA